MPLLSSVEELRGILGQSLTGFQSTYMSLSETKPCRGVFGFLWRHSYPSSKKLTF